MKHRILSFHVITVLQRTMANTLYGTRALGIMVVVLIKTNIMQSKMMNFNHHDCLQARLTEGIGHYCSFNLLLTLLRVNYYNIVTPTHLLRTFLQLRQCFTR